MHTITSISNSLDNWKQRVQSASPNHFGQQVHYFMNWINLNLILRNVLNQLINKYPYSDIELHSIEKKLQSRETLMFEHEDMEVAFAHLFLNYLIKNVGYNKLKEILIFQGKDGKDTQRRITEMLLLPQIHYLKEELAGHSSVIYLLERYKFRCEWFTKHLLINSYDSAVSSFEQIFEDDLRQFLFDQGIDYPFSTPKSPSGRTDIIGNINTNDPLVIEIKIIDKTRGYGKNRLKSGFSQVLKYANDFNKNVGYLVVFNIDDSELNFTFSNPMTSFFPYLNFNNKIFYFVVINCSNGKTASKIGKIEALSISDVDLY